MIPGWGPATNKKPAASQHGFFISLLAHASLARRKIKKPRFARLLIRCGKRGIRTLDTLRYTRFPGVPVQPLLHLSVIDPVFLGTANLAKFHKRKSRRAFSVVIRATSFNSNAFTSANFCAINGIYSLLLRWPR